MSLTAPISARIVTASVSAINCTSPAMPASAAPSQRLASAAATTAMPPPCGVGAVCEERAFGRASA